MRSRALVFAASLLGTVPAARVAAQRIVVTLPTDTVVSADTGVLRIGVHAPAHGAVRVAITPLGDTTPLFRDSAFAPAGGALLFAWPPQVPPGILGLRVVARDSSGDSLVAVRTIVVTRFVTDYRAGIPPLPTSAFAPESAYRRRPRVGPLAVGLAFGAAAATLATLGADGTHGGDGRAFAVGGALGVAGIAGFVKGRRVSRPLPENIERNRRLRLADAQRRAQLATTTPPPRTLRQVHISVSPGLP